MPIEVGAVAVTTTYVLDRRVKIVTLVDGSVEVEAESLPDNVGAVMVTTYVVYRLVTMLVLVES